MLLCSHVEVMGGVGISLGTFNACVDQAVTNALGQRQYSIEVYLTPGRGMIDFTCVDQLLLLSIQSIIRISFTTAAGSRVTATTGSKGTISLPALFASLFLVDLGIRLFI